MIRFHISSEDGEMSTDWMEEADRNVAVEKVAALRKEHGQNAAIRIERDHTIVTAKPERFRFEIFMREGTILVKDEEGKKARKVDGLKLQSRPFQASERETVRAELIEKFPKAILTEVKV